MKPLSTKQFIRKAEAIHGFKYDYSQVSYVNNITSVTIICPIHGAFSQKPIYHVQRKSGCPTCYRDSRKYTEDVFLQRAHKQFGDRFSYGSYLGFRAPIEVVCAEHGAFKTTPLNHLIQDGGCGQCRSKKLAKSRKDWIEQFNKVHNNKYDYTKTLSIRSDEKLTVICPEHGLFFPTANNHLKGHSCPICARLHYVGGYSEEYFQINPHKKDEMGILYIIRLWDNFESFFKVGITNRSVKLRFKNVLPYEYMILNEKQMTLYNAHLEEQQILTTTVRYTPAKHFPGWTECFDVNCFDF